MKQLGVLTAIAVFFMVEYWLFGSVDRPISQYMHDIDKPHGGAVNFFRAITDFGKSNWYLWPTGLITIFAAFLSRSKELPKHYRDLCGYIGTRCFLVFATIGVSGIVCDAIKPMAGRARPVMWFREGIYGFSPFTSQGSLWNSMPSGHTATAFALACSLAMLFPKGTIIWFAYALLLAASRVYVNAHYLSDVIAGATIGWLTVKLLTQYGVNSVLGMLFPIEKPAKRK